MPKTDVDEAAPEEHDEPEYVKPTARGGASRTSFILVAVAAAVFALLAVVLGIVAVGKKSDKSDSADRTEITTTAARMAEAITAVDPNGNGTLAATVQEFGTSPVVSQYNEISDAMRKVMGPLKLTSIKGSVKEVYVGNIDGSEAKVIIRLDLVYVGDNTRVIPDQYLDMSLAKLDGTWKVDNVQVLNVALASGAPSPTSAPTSSSSG